MTTRNALGCAMILALAAAPAAAGQVRQAGMAQIPAGTYVPLYAASAKSVSVAAFRLDVHPVTRGEFREFARINPRWTDAATTSGATIARGTDLRRPVTNVSWHAARAYCAAQGKRLPTLDEWEYAAAASRTKRNAITDPAFVQRLVTMYANRAQVLPPVANAERNAYGVRGMHDLAWEWFDEVGRAAAHDHAMHARNNAYCASAALGATTPNNYPAFLRFAVRSALTPETTMETLGFRCAK